MISYLYIMTTLAVYQYDKVQYDLCMYVDLLHKSHNAPIPYLTMHIFVTNRNMHVGILLL